MPRTMQHIDRQLVFDAIDEVDGARLYGSETLGYSGRGMHGETCLGIVIESASDWGELASVLTATFLVVEQQRLYDESLPQLQPWEDSEDIRRMIRRAQLDSLGRDTIVYFPGWQLKKED